VFRVTAVMDVRYSLTPLFLAGAAAQSRLAREIESRSGEKASREDEIAHRGFVIGAVLQSAAAIEADLWNVVHNGPGEPLGTNRIDSKARDFLAPLADMLDGERTMERCAYVLHLLGKPAFERGCNPWQDAALLVRLRNELVHYKSRLASEVDQTSFVEALRSQALPEPPFRAPNTLGWFPHGCLSAARAAWAVKASSAFIDGFNERLGVRSPLAHWQDDLQV
jgi:hypothetical protein